MARKQGSVKPRVETRQGVYVNKSTQSISVRLSNETAKQVKDRAHAMGLTQSQFLQQAIHQMLEQT